MAIPNPDSMGDAAWQLNMKAVGDAGAVDSRQRPIADGTHGPTAQRKHGCCRSHASDTGSRRPDGSRCSQADSDW